MTQGALHPITQITRLTVAAFGDMGFDIVDAPEIDTAWYSLEGLRINQDHPVQLGQDTFWLTDNRLLRPHTTNMQLHVAEHKKPPLRVMHFGPCYRNDATDATHDVAFTHLDCLAIDEGLTVSHLLATLEAFITRVLGPDTKYRFRPHYFPFTEPSIEVDIWHNDRWLELLGSGMVHPEVLKNMGIDSNVYTGFAFGIGIERIAYIKWGIEDIRHFHGNKISFLRQFRTSV